jgi:LPS export ABC transporter protein LptC
MSPKRVAQLLAAFGAVALAAILIVAIKVVRQRSVGHTLVEASGLIPGALLHAHNFHWTQMKGDQSQWVLRAKDANYSPDKSSLVLTDALLSMTAKDGKHFDLDAAMATITLSGNHISRAELSGGVVIHYGDFVVTTKDGSFSPDSDQVDASGPVQIEGEGLSVSGVGLSGHPKAETLELLKQVSTKILPKQKRASSKAS